MKSHFNAVIILFVLFISCAPEKQTSDTPKRIFPDIFKNGLEAHGGLETWDSYGTLTFSEVNETDTTQYTIDLKTRDELIEKFGAYKISYFQDSIIIFPNKDSFPGKDPKFFHNLRFYFFSIPFVTADNGAFQEELPPQELNGITYNRVKVTFGEGVGDAPKDQYILWFNQTDNMLALINYSVTYYDENKAENYNAIVYQNWKEVGGLKLPQEMIGYKWENNTLGEERYRKKFADITLTKDQPEKSFFTKLEE